MKEVLDELAAALRADPESAWGWHCNLTMMAISAGADIAAANDEAAEFMMTHFNVDTKSYLARLREPDP
jgi:hypothetical protein